MDELLRWRATGLAALAGSSLAVALCSDVWAQVGGTAAGSAISSARTFDDKISNVHCPDPAVRNELERQGRAIIGQLQDLTSAAINAHQSDVSGALIDASVAVSEALRGLDCPPDAPTVHSVVRNVTYLPLAPLPVIPYVGLGLSLNKGTGDFSEGGSTTPIDTRGGQFHFGIGMWSAAPNPLFSWGLYQSGAPFGSYDDAEFYDYCYYVGWDDDDCYDYWGDVGPYEADARLDQWAKWKLEHGVFRSRYAPERKKSRPAVKWPIKPAKPAKPGFPDAVLRFGIENNLSFGRVSGSTTTNCAASCWVSNTVLDTLVGKVGVQFGRVMPYLAAGLAYGNIRTGAGAFPGNTTWNVGWTAGGGIEYKFTRSLSAKFEYLYVDLGSGSCTPATCGGTATARFTENIARVGLTYAFGSTPWTSAPRTASYPVKAPPLK